MSPPPRQRQLLCLSEISCTDAHVLRHAIEKKMCGSATHCCPHALCGNQEDPGPARSSAPNTLSAFHLISACWKGALIGLSAPWHRTPVHTAPLLFSRPQRGLLCIFGCPPRSVGYARGGTCGDPASRCIRPGTHLFRYIL